MDSRRPSSSGGQSGPESPTPRRPSSCERGSSSVNLSPRDGPSSNGNAALAVNASRTARPAAVGAASPGSSVSQPGGRSTRKRPPGSGTRLLANSHGANAPSNPRGPPAPGLVGLISIRQGDCYPALLSRGCNQPVTPPSSLTSSLEVEVGYDNVPSSAMAIGATLNGQQVPWDPTDMLLGVGGGSEPNHGQFDGHGDDGDLGL